MNPPELRMPRTVVEPFTVSTVNMLVVAAFRIWNAFAELTYDWMVRIDEVP